MNNIDKSLLLAELFGVDVNRFVDGYVERVRSSPEYLKLRENMTKIRTYGTVNAREIIEKFEAIDFSKISTFEEATIVNAKIFELLRRSSINNGFNPLLPTFSDSSILTFGQIEIDFDGRKTSINDIVFAQKEYSVSYKSKALKDGCDSWRKDANTYFLGPINYLKTINKKRSVRNKIFSFIYLFFLAAINLVLVGIFFVPNDRLVSMLNPGGGITSYTLYFTLVMIIITDIVCALLYSFKINYLASKRYLIRQFSLKGDKSFIELSKRTIALNKYLQAYLSSQVLTGDAVSRFAKPYSSRIDLSNYLRFEKRLTTKTYRVVIVLRRISMVLLLISLVAMTTIFVLYYYGVLN